MINKKYPYGIIENLRLRTPIFYLFYNISIVFSFIFISSFFWYFIYLAYTENMQNYNLLCTGNCTPFVSILIFIILFLLILNLVFYTINEIRFRFIIIFKKIRKINLYKSNILPIFFASLFNAVAGIVFIAIVSYHINFEMKNLTKDFLDRRKEKVYNFFVDSFSTITFITAILAILQLHLYAGIN